MSSKCVADVFENSPYTGSTFAVHLAVADSVNDLHDYELWARHERIAQKARVTRETAQRAIKVLVRDGWMVVLEDNARAGRANRYRWMVVEQREGVTNDHTPSDDASHGGVTNDHTEPKEQPKKNSLADAVRPDFERLWKRYPKKAGKTRAFDCYVRLRRDGVSDEDIVEGVRRYCKRCRAEDREIRFFKDLSAVLGRQGVWKDELDRNDPIDQEDHRGMDTVPSYATGQVAE